jgi:hypothetical protein
MSKPGDPVRHRFEGGEKRRRERKELSMKYMLSIIGEEATRETEPSPEEMQGMIQPWSDYSREVIEAGKFVAGEGLQPSATATTIKHAPGGERIVSDGPFAETKEQLGGFYLLECDDLDEALEWAKKIPVAEGGSVEVKPVMDFTGMDYFDPYEAKAAAS